MTPPAEAHAQPDLEPLWDTEARAIVDHAIDRYIAARHERVAAVRRPPLQPDRLLAPAPSGLWCDLVRAPANVLLMLPYLGMQAGGAALRRLGARQAARRLGRTLFLDTDVGRELTWLLHTELLELPYDDGGRRSKRDALAETILADARVAAAVDVLATLARRHAADPDRRARLRHLLDDYASTRAPLPTSSTTSCWRARA